MPGLLTVALLSFEAGWNNFLWPLLVTTSENLRVIQVGISSFRQEAATDWHLLMAGTTMAAVPMIILFLDLPALLRAGLRRPRGSSDYATRPPLPQARRCCRRTCEAPASPCPRRRARRGRSRFEMGIGRRDPLEARGLVRLLTKPAALPRGRTGRRCWGSSRWWASCRRWRAPLAPPPTSRSTRTPPSGRRSAMCAARFVVMPRCRSLLLLVLGGIADERPGAAGPDGRCPLRVFAVGLMLPVMWLMIRPARAPTSPPASRDQHVRTRRDRAGRRDARDEATARGACQRLPSSPCCLRSWLLAPLHDRLRRQRPGLGGGPGVGRPAQSRGRAEPG